MAATVTRFASGQHTVHFICTMKPKVAKLPKSHIVLLTKKTRRLGHLRPPFRPNLTDGAQNFANVVGP